MVTQLLTMSGGIPFGRAYLYFDVTLGRRAVASVLNSPYQKPFHGLGNAQTIYPISAFITHLVYLEDTSIAVDEENLTALGVQCVRIKGVKVETAQEARYGGEVVREAVRRILLA